jgi:hypothetical protein
MFSEYSAYRNTMGKHFQQWPTCKLSFYVLCDLFVLRWKIFSTSLALFVPTRGLALRYLCQQEGPGMHVLFRRIVDSTCCLPPDQDLSNIAWRRAIRFVPLWHKATETAIYLVSLIITSFQHWQLKNVKVSIASSLSFYRFINKNYK